LSFGGGTPISDNFQKSKEKNWGKFDFFEAMQWATLKFMFKVHLWLSFGYLFELAVSDEKYPYAPLKFSSSSGGPISPHEKFHLDIVSKALPSVACKF